MTASVTSTATGPALTRTCQHEDERVGVLTERWGWQPLAWWVDGLPAWRWRSAPAGLVTRRQMRAEGLAPGGRPAVALVMCRGGRRWARLWVRAECVAKRTPTPAQLDAVAAALAARRWCPGCQRDAGYVVPPSVGVCGRCDPPLDFPGALPCEQDPADLDGADGFDGSGELDDLAAAA